MTIVHKVDAAQLAAINIEKHRYANDPYSLTPAFNIPPGPVFVQYNEEFQSILGDHPSIEVVGERDWPFAHEAGVYIPMTNEIYITSNIIEEGNEKKIKISKFALGHRNEKGHYQITHLEKASRDILMGNGGTNYKKGILFCSQGNLYVQSSLIHMDVNENCTVILSNFHGRQFNSLNDVVIHPSGSIWFTDPAYGFEQMFKPPPSLPNQVYAYSPNNGVLRVVADGFEKPNGIAFSPDYKTCYITDTSFITGTGDINPQRKAHIYAFDVVVPDEPDYPYLINRRVFAYTDCGAPDGIKCDNMGNVYSGVFDGVHVWNEFGVLLGKILLPQGFGCANLVFGPKGKLFILAETRIYQVNFEAQGALALH